MRVASKLIIAASMLTSTVAVAQVDVGVAASQKMREFYGIPLDLKLWDLKKLPFASELGWKSDEGEVYPTAKIVVSKNVSLDASFDSGGELYMLETSSRNAVGPRGIAVGASLAEVRNAWPTGRLLWGVNHADHYVTFDTKEGLYYQFSPAALPAEAWAHSSEDYNVDPSTRVITIRLAAQSLGKKNV